MTRASLIIVAVAALLVMSDAAAAQVMVTSPLNKHNLSSSGPGPVKSDGTTEICIFCHAPHNSSPVPPLWNQTLSGATYTPYTSTTMSASAGVPTGSSKLCLSCHDGTVALGSTISQGQLTMAGLTGGKLTGPSNIGTNLANSHPISFAPLTGAEIVNPAASSDVKLDSTGRIQCVTCHDPHRMDVDSTTQKFLVTSNASSAMCLTCHKKQYWSTGTHSTSNKAYTAAMGAHTGYTTVAANGCESCHKPHLAGAALSTRV